MAKQLDTLLLLALPASGKSEVRTFLASLNETQCREEFGLGPTVQLDDYPYVHMMRRIDEELETAGHKNLFFHAQDKPFIDAYDWGTLIALVNEDYEDLHSKKVVETDQPARHLFQRVDAARQAIGRDPKLATLDDNVLSALAEKLDAEAAELLAEKHANYQDLEGKTIVIEFARGGAQGSDMPLAEPFGYQYSVGTLSDHILSRSKVLYIWVTPEESRRKNDERARPDEQGSILHHGVPISVMLGDYGCDDMSHLLEVSGKPDVISISAHGKTFDLPVKRFDNRVDKTSFIREPQDKWPEAERSELHNGLAAALSALSEM